MLILIIIFKLWSEIHPFSGFQNAAWQHFSRTDQVEHDMRQKYILHTHTHTHESPSAVNGVTEGESGANVTRNKPKIVLWQKKQFKTNISFQLCQDQNMTHRIGRTNSGSLCRLIAFLWNHNWDSSLKSLPVGGHRCTTALPVRSPRERETSCEVIADGAKHFLWGVPSGIAVLASEDEELGLLWIKVRSAQTHM